MNDKHQIKIKKYYDPTKKKIELALIFLSRILNLLRTSGQLLKQEILKATNENFNKSNSILLIFWPSTLKQTELTKSVNNEDYSNWSTAITVKLISQSQQFEETKEKFEVDELKK